MFIIMVKAHRIKRVLLWLILCSIHLPKSNAAEQHYRQRAYHLESVTVIGSQRINAHQVTTLLGLTKGLALTHEFVMTARAHLLSLGLFNSVLLRMSRGSKRNQVELIIELTDNKSVFSSWALGSSLALHYQAFTSKNNQQPFSFNTQIISRNLFNTQARGAAKAQVNTMGKIIGWQIAYSIPQLLREKTQFDAAITVKNSRYHFLDVNGYGGDIKALWSYNYEQNHNFLYGIAMYINHSPNYGLPGYPRAVAGPSFGFFTDSRLHTFMPNTGQLVKALVTVATRNIIDSVIKLQFANTIIPWSDQRFTTSLLFLESHRNLSSRLNFRLDLPIKAQHSKQKAALFVLARYGNDWAAENSYTSYSINIGYRYYNPGFIGELSLSLVQNPNHLFNYD